jgi:hypothetical protein
MYHYVPDTVRVGKKALKFYTAVTIAQNFGFTIYRHLPDKAN